MTNDGKKKQAEDRALLSQQNKEYADSLAKDLARLETKEKIRVEAEKKEQRKKTIQEYKEKVKDTKSTGSLHLLVRFPNGSRSIIHFSPSDPITNLFDSIISQPACPDYFSVRSVHPKGEIQCFPDWYQSILKEEFIDDEDVPRKEDQKTSTSLMKTIPNNSILFINMIH